MVLALQGDEVDFVEHFSVSGGKALLDDPNVQVIAVRTARTGSCTCARTWSRSPTSASARRWRCRSTGRRWSTVSGRARPISATTAPSRRCIPSTDTSVPPARSRTSSSGEAADGRRRHGRRLRGGARHAGTDSRSPTWPSSSRTTPSRSASPSTSRSPTRAPTTATASSASRPGSTRSWASPTTATAECRTCT